MASDEQNEAQGQGEYGAQHWPRAILDTATDDFEMEAGDTKDDAPAAPNDAHRSEHQAAAEEEEDKYAIDEEQHTSIDQQDPPIKEDELEEHTGAEASDAASDTNRDVGARRLRRTHGAEGSAKGDVLDADAFGKGIEYDEQDDSEGVTRCVCGSTDENVGLMIQCETCKCWQHCACMGMHTEEDCPDVYFCEQCRPENHIELLRSLGFLPPPKVVKRGASRSSRVALAKEHARELNDAREAIRVMAQENVARLRAEAGAAEERTSPSARRTRKHSPDADARVPPKRRSTMNSREFGGDGWEHIPPSLLQPEEYDARELDSPEDSLRKRKRIVDEPPSLEPEGVADAGKRRRTQEANRNARDTPDIERREVLQHEPRAASHAPRSKHDAPIPMRAREIVRASRDVGSRQGTPTPGDGGAKSAPSTLPEHLAHLAYLVPPLPGEEKEGKSEAKVPGLPEPFALVAVMDTATKIRYPQKRMTLSEMRKRIRTIGDYVARVQIEAVEREKRVQFLARIMGGESDERAVAPAPNAVPLSMQLAEQLTRDLTAFQRRFGVASVASRALTELEMEQVDA
ncbi:Histone deacetylase complex subunit [Malassezia vespertilionis]|nr:Histone deacetylase complex subunit [Malassezia vespertilionis]WFD08309.1 Histone deacetylase complex subunit [Malassezia vespertilionis]